MKIDERLYKLIKDQNEDVDNITLDSKLDDMGYNSYKFVELVVNIELEYDIIFDDEGLDFRKYETVKDLVDYIEAQR